MSFRRLTAGERALAAEVFAGGLDAARVWILAIPAWGRAFVPGRRLMVWPAPAARTDFADPATPLDDQATFVHELTHVWQAQNGVALLLAKLMAGDSAASYAYDLTSGLAFPAMNIEQQAMVVEDAFRLSRGGVAPHPPELYDGASVHWRRRR
ncbi:hypothetical protein [uncultured Phenylobacterium sp.]|uniref:hypothetical protein n=1 Tax=uncultured Phenylobacterium sp. TaxID=349273 RepID=UPI0025CC1A4A|nr:hypothetical protein [uncultured Phenylobacterium sp.]